MSETRIGGVNAEVVTFNGQFPPKGGGAVSSAKSKFAERHGVEYGDVHGRLLGYNANDPIVVVAEDPIAAGELESKW